MLYFPSALLAFFFSLFLVGQVAAAPFPLPIVVAVEGSIGRRDVAVEQASKSDGGDVVPYNKRQVPVQAASKSDGNGVVPYDKRQVPVQQASKSDGNGVIPYDKRQVPVQQASKSDNGDVVPYGKREPSEGSADVLYGRDFNIPLHVAVRSVDGVVELY